jgi:hypothetical protein
MHVMANRVRWVRLHFEGEDCGFRGARHVAAEQNYQRDLIFHSRQRAGL